MPNLAPKSLQGLLATNWLSSNRILEEELEEFAEHALCISMDAWGDLSTDMANAAAKEAFIHGVSDKDVAFITMSQNLGTLDDTLAFLKRNP